MALWMLLVLSLCGLLRAQDTAMVQMCCQDGRDRALRGQHCAVLPPISSSHSCRIAQEHCCVATLEERHCTQGINMALRQGACETAFLARDIREGPGVQVLKRCCDCCLLGQLVTEKGLGCGALGVLLNKFCAATAEACCGKNSADDAKPDAGVVSGLPANSTCSQLPTANGSCSCYNGFELQSDGVSCQDIDECLRGTHNCVSADACINTPGSFRCQRETGCSTGYELRDNGCQDIDECALGTHNCTDLVCVNTPGAFHCRALENCTVGFVRGVDGTCMDINECVVNDAPCPPNTTCVNTEGSYTCRSSLLICRRGYRRDVNGTRCEDVDECTENVCGIHSCVNVDGSYRCECNSGYFMNSLSNQCTDINECEQSPERPCQHRCENTEGSYVCSCTRGFKLSPDGRHCDDIDECEDQPCGQECSNTIGSYQCYCRHGYQLGNDGTACEDIDECALAAGGALCSYRCTNTAGGFSCLCPTGYQLSANKRSCQDVDECAAGTHNCTVSENCFNVLGGFRCLSSLCPPNYQKSSQGRCERVTCEFTRDPASCRSLPLRISYYTISFPANTPVPADVFRMGPSNSVPGDRMLLSVVSGDEDGHFVVTQHAHGGVISLFRALPEPRDFLLTVEMTLIRYGTPHLFMAKISVFVTREQPIRASRYMSHYKTDDSVNFRCAKKACAQHDSRCKLNPVQHITFWSFSVPYRTEFRKNREILFLRKPVPADPSSPRRDADFEIVSADGSPGCFDVVKHIEDNAIMAVIRQVEYIPGPRDVELRVAMKSTTAGTFTHQHDFIIRLFIPEFSF